MIMIAWQDRLRAASIHLTLSLLVAALAALLVFGLWYPAPYREISGGRELFLLVVTVDVVLGPLITLAIFNRAKSRRHLLADFSVVGLLQLAALGYGLWTVSAARPVHLVFEYNRFRVVHAVEIPASELDAAPAGIEALPLSGPTPLALRPLSGQDEQFQLTRQALEGVPLSARPALWIPYEHARTQVLEAAGPVVELRARLTAYAPLIDQAIAQTHRPAESLAYLPLVGRKSFWTVLLDRQTAQPLAYLPLDSFL